MAQSTRQQLLEHIRTTKQAHGVFGEGNWQSEYQVYFDDNLVWFGRKIWKVPQDIIDLLAN